MERVLGFVWACSEHDLAGAGPDISEKYQCMSFAGYGSDYPVHKEIKEMYKAEGKQPPREMLEISGFYNRGILWMAVPLEAIRLGYQNFGWPLTGEKVKKGFELIRGFSLGGVIPPMDITPEDHEGGGWITIVEVKDGKFVKKVDWFKGFRDEVMEQLAFAAKEEAKGKK